MDGICEHGTRCAHVGREDGGRACRGGRSRGWALKLANVLSSGKGGRDVGGKPGSMVSWKAGDCGARGDRGRGSSGRSTQLLLAGEGVKDREMRLWQRGVSSTPWIPVNSASTDGFHFQPLMLISLWADIYPF